MGALSEDKHVKNQLERQARLLDAVTDIVAHTEARPGRRRSVTPERLGDRLAMKTQVSSVRSYLSLECC